MPIIAAETIMGALPEISLGRGDEVETVSKEITLGFIEPEEGRGEGGCIKGVMLHQFVSSWWATNTTADLGSSGFFFDTEKSVASGVPLGPRCCGA
jgi:hypothetical protein